MWVFICIFLSYFLPLLASSSQSSPFSSGLHFLILPIKQENKQKKKAAMSSSYANASLDVPSYFVVAVQFWAAACVPPGKSIAGSFVLSVFLEAIRAHLHVLTARSFIYIVLNAGSSSLSGQLIMDFDYSHFVLVSAVPSPTGGPAERPAPLIVSVSGLIEPNGNGCCQSSLFSSVYILIHKRDIHYGLTENSSRHVHKHTHVLTFAVVLMRGWRCQ